MTSGNKLTLWIFIAMVAGIATGALYRNSFPDEASLKAFGENISILTDIFLRLVKMIIAPHVLSTLVVGAPLSIPRDECCHFVSGRATYTHESGEVIEVVRGTVVLFKAGWTGTCTVHETLRNVYMLS